MAKKQVTLADMLNDLEKIVAETGYEDTFVAFARKTLTTAIETEPKLDWVKKNEDEV